MIEQIVTLNERWRITDDPLQWILSYREGKIPDSDKSWRGHRYCRTKAALLRDIRENAGAVDPAAIAVIETWPDWHPDRKKEKAAARDKPGDGEITLSGLKPAPLQRNKNHAENMRNHT